MAVFHEIYARRATFYSKEITDVILQVGGWVCEVSQQGFNAKANLQKPIKIESKLGFDCIFEESMPDYLD